MPRLIINPGSSDAWAQELPPGTYTVGRNVENDIAIEHPSISSSHCQLVVTETKATLKDLGSTNGTFLDGQLVEEAVLKPGQKFHLGEVAMLFEAKAPAVVARLVSPEEKVARAAAAPAVSTSPSPPHAPAPPPGVAPAAPAIVSGACCKTHKRTAARYRCPQCHQAFCDLCVNTRQVAGATHKFCRACGSPCEPLHVEVALPAPPAGFFQLLPGAFSYPLKGNGLVLIIGGGVFFLLLGLLPIIGLLITGYLFSYAKRIVVSTTEGDDEPPDWPDFTNWGDDILMPYFHLAALVLLSFGPAILLGIFLPEHQTFRAGWILLATALGAFLAPMGMLALSVFDSVGALNPVALVWSISRIPGYYLAAAIAFELVIAVYMKSEDLIGGVLSSGFLAYIIAGFLNLYLMAVAMRILGLLYRAKKAELGWFSR